MNSVSFSSKINSFFCRVRQVSCVKAPLVSFYMLFHLQLRFWNLWAYCQGVFGSVGSTFQTLISVKLTCWHFHWRSSISGPEAGRCTCSTATRSSSSSPVCKELLNVHEQRKTMQILPQSSDLEGNRYLLSTTVKADYHHVQTFHIQAELLLHLLTCRRFCAKSWIKKEGQGESDSSPCSNNPPQLTHAAPIPALTVHIY